MTSSAFNFTLGNLHALSPYFSAAFLTNKYVFVLPCLTFWKFNHFSEESGLNPTDPWQAFYDIPWWYENEKSTDAVDSKSDDSDDES